MSFEGGTTDESWKDSAPPAKPALVPLYSMLFDGEQELGTAAPNVFLSQPRDFFEQTSPLEDRSKPNSAAASPNASVPNRRLAQPNNQPSLTPYNLADDVQYFPAGPESKPAGGTTPVPAKNAWAVYGQDQKAGSVAQSSPGGSSAHDGRTSQQAADVLLNAPSVDFSKSETLLSTTVNVPDGGTISRGGIRRLRDSRTDQGDPQTSTLTMTVTPGIKIPEEEEEALGQSYTTNFNRASQQLGVEVQTLRQYSNWAKEKSIVDNSERLDQVVTPLANRLNPTGTKALSIRSMGEDQVELTIQEVDETFPSTDTHRPLTRNGIAKSLSDSADSTRTEEQARGLQTLGRSAVELKSRLAGSPEIAKDGKELADRKSDLKPTSPKQPAALDEQSSSAEAFSTFSLHVSDVSFKLAQAALGQGQWPEAAKIRIEEFVNALDYHDPLPTGNQKVACLVEQAIHPFLMQRNILRVSMRTAATGRSQNTPLRLTLLLDNSGSMERPDRRQAVLRAFQTLTQQLKETDQVTLISFASTPRLLADKIPGNQGETLLKLIENLPSEGGTNIESALLLAHEKAAEQQVVGAQNRIVLLTDGAVNLGDANPESLAKLVTQMRDSGIAFDAAGISAQDLNDEVLEALTRQGDGRYYLLDSAADVGESFAAQIAGSLRPSAQNVKVQVEFNPQRVGRYKLMGFEKHQLNKEDFRNDQVDAAEMAAAEAGVALYQFEIKPNGSGDVGSVSVRFRDLSTGQMVERRWPILYESNTPRLERAQASLQLATSAALFAAKLGGGPLADSVDLAQLQNLLATLPEQFASQPRVQQLRAMIEQAIAIH